MYFDFDEVKQSMTVYQKDLLKEKTYAQHFETALYEVIDLYNETRLMPWWFKYEPVPVHFTPYKNYNN